MAGYDQAFFDQIRDGCQSSAGVVAPLIHTFVQPASVVDVGCGEGWWGRAFERLDCEVVGIDGPGTSCVLPRFVAQDLRQRIRIASLPQDRFELAVCLEVAEHLPDRRAGSLVKDLCALAPVVLFSAAIPGQGGTHHVNEQWPFYWVELFKAQGYAVSGALRWMVWDDDRVENWYRQNLLVAALRPASLPELFDTPLAPPWPVVHPVLWDARRPR